MKVKLGVLVAIVLLVSGVVGFRSNAESYGKTESCVVENYVKSEMTTDFKTTKSVIEESAGDREAAITFESVAEPEAVTESEPTMEFETVRESEMKAEPEDSTTSEDNTDYEIFTQSEIAIEAEAVTELLSETELATESAPVILYGSAGRLLIPSAEVNVALNWGSGQEICDEWDSACYFSYGNLMIVADHCYQEFARLYDVCVGDVACIQQESGSIYITCYEVSYGINTGTEMYDSAGELALKRDGYLMYTCTSNTRDVLQTWWY